MKSNQTVNQTVMLPVDKLTPHPGNPRKNLGDLTELAESIRQNGILQNLTAVCGQDGLYTVIIGHKRLEAAKLAGLTEVPCMVVDMDEKSQISAMLIENIQRSDLTPIEQAEGFQMVIDLGGSVSDVAKETGFSENTIKKRLFIATLDKDKSQEAFDKGARLEDFCQLSHVEDEDSRDKLLESLGTNNFSHDLKRALSAQLKNSALPKITKLLSPFSKEFGGDYIDYGIYSHFKSVRYEDFANTGELGFSVNAEETKDGDYVYLASLYEVVLYRKNANAPSRCKTKMSDLPKEEQEIRRKRRKNCLALKELSETAYRLRLDFVSKYEPRKSKATEELAAIAGIMPYVVHNSNAPSFPHICSIAGRDDLCDHATHGYDTLLERIKILCGKPVKLLFLAIYQMLRDSGENGYYKGSSHPDHLRGQHTGNDSLTAIYDFLCSLGYKMSDDETALQNGTHTLFEPAAQ